MSRTDGELLHAAARPYGDPGVKTRRVGGMASDLNAAKRPRIVIAGTNSGAGKTTVTLALMAALIQAGYKVQGFKAGPDYIDASYHAAVTGRPGRNLDGWLQGRDGVSELFWRASADADVSVIEGVMGMYDGKDALTETGSTAELAKLLDAPVLLVIDGWALARSAAAVVLGFQQLDPAVRIAGVIVNRVAGAGHFDIIRAAVEQVCGVPVIGCLTNEPALTMPERHLGLVPAAERGELDPLFERLGAAVRKTLPLDKVLAAARSAPPRTQPVPRIFAPPSAARPLSQVTLAVARDEAFNFYYPENLELLEWNGARLIEFSPLHGERIPADACGVYIGGGFPEEFARRLSAQEAVRASFRSCIEAGLPVLAECGGFMFLTESITDRQGDSYPMVGVIPARVQMKEHLMALGYREAVGVRDNLLLQTGETVRGHEFHYSTVTYDTPHEPAYRLTEGPADEDEGFRAGNLLAGYTHLHFASNPAAAARFVAACQSYAALRGS